MGAHELAGKPVPPSLLANIPRLVTAYYGEEHLKRIQEEAMAIVNAAYKEALV